MLGKKEKDKMSFTAEWADAQNLWEIRGYGKHDAVNYVRTFLGHDQVYVPMKEVLIFETIPDVYRANPFMKQAMDAIHYNHIEIIAYDDGKKGSLHKYQEILKNCGYSYIEKIALASEFGQRKCNFQFFKKMIATYNPKGNKYGMISNRMNFFAKINHLDFLLYKSPDVYPYRYYFGKKLKKTEQIFTNFINEQLFNGSIKESKGYHFGYAFEGILCYGFLRFIKNWKETNQIGNLYFTETSSTLCQAYANLYPDDDVEIIYIEQRTQRNMALTEYLQRNVQKYGMVVDFSIQDDLKEYLQNKVGKDVKVCNLKDFFGKKVSEKYYQDIHRAVEMARESSFYVEYYRQNLPVWKEEKEDLKSIRNRQEIQRGIFDFVWQFNTYIKGYVEDTAYGASFASFIGKVLHYAFDEVERSKPHLEPVQAIVQSKAAKDTYHIIKRFYQKMKRSA